MNKIFPDNQTIRSSVRLFLFFVLTTWYAELFVPRIEPVSPALEEWSLIYWTTREIP